MRGMFDIQGDAAHGKAEYEASLLPCPFCGHRAEIMDYNEAGRLGYAVTCSNPDCSCSLGDDAWWDDQTGEMWYGKFRTLDECKLRWNRRR